MTGKFEPEMFEDRYENAMIELIHSKQAGQPVPKERPTAPPPNVVNLMDALRRSIEAGNGKGKPADKPAPAKSTARPRRKAAKG
jgi:DNA end-binding protein Ku